MVTDCLLISITVLVISAKFLSTISIWLPGTIVATVLRWSHFRYIWLYVFLCHCFVQSQHHFISNNYLLCLKSTFWDHGQKKMSSQTGNSSSDPWKTPFSYLTAALASVFRLIMLLLKIHDFLKYNLFCFYF